MVIDEQFRDMAGERNKILKVLIGVVSLVGLFSIFANYITLQLPIVGSQRVSLLDALKVVRESPSQQRVGVIRLTNVRVREKPNHAGRVMGTAKNGSRLTIFGESDGWSEIATSEGKGWVESKYLDVEEPPMRGLPDIKSLLKNENIDPAVLAPFENLPPYSPYLPLLAIVFLATSLLLLPFVVGPLGIGVYRTLISLSLLLAAYSLVFHLLFVQALKEAISNLADSLFRNASGGGNAGAFAGMFSQVLANNVNLSVGPALYVLGASCLVATAIGLFLVRQDVVFVTVEDEVTSLGRFLER